MTEFSLELIQAINNWQRGGDAKQKKKRAGVLSPLARALPTKYRVCKDFCYRQLCIGKGAVYELNDNLKLLEAISSWTLDPLIAQDFKEGVP